MSAVDLDKTPESIIRLASVIYRFKIPSILRKVSFTKAFKTVGTANGTKALMTNADDSREILCSSCESLNVSSDRVISDAKRYYPLIHTILVSCKVQADQARLDDRVVFEWKSGIESKSLPFKSEVMMYDFVMTLATLGLAHGVSATENSLAGDFVSSSREYSSASGIFSVLADDQLPRWTTKGGDNNKVIEDQIPIECNPIMAKVFCNLFMANGQQMAIATLLIKDGKPNYSLLSKLCLGVSEQLEKDVINVMNVKIPNIKSKIDNDFFILTNLQISIQKVLANYYLSRSLWEQDDHGTAIALLSETNISFQQQKKVGSDGIIDVTKLPNLKHLNADIIDLRQHMILLLRSWEKDNSTVYFSIVPKLIPNNKRLQNGIQMKKKTDFIVPEVEPVLLSIPKHSILNVSSFFRKTTA